MAECKLISPLLDGMTVVSELSQRSGASCFTLKHEALDKLFVVKQLSIPESEEKTEALLLTGAFADAQAAHEYYGQIVEDLKQELSQREKLSDFPNFSAVLGYQVEPKQSGIGYDVYILSEYSKTMQEMMSDRGMTGLDAINLGIDVCNALSVLRSQNLVFENLKPENIFVDSNDRFMLGDLGLAATDFLQFSSLPEQYKGIYTAPEFSDMMANLNLTMDTYALGMLLYRIYNGYHGPFEDEKTSPAGAEQRRLDGEELPTPLYADYELSEIILKACAPKIDDRYQTPEEFGQALALYMQRNSISDDLIVPPIVADPEPEIPVEELDAPVEPVSFTDVSELSSEFVDSFRPDTERAVKDAEAEMFTEAQADAHGAEVDELIASAASMLDDKPASEEAPLEELPAEEAPIEEAPAEEISEQVEQAVDVPAEEAPAEEAEATAEEEATESLEENASEDVEDAEAPEQDAKASEDPDSEILTLPDKVAPRKQPDTSEDTLEIVESDEEPKMPVKRSSSKHSSKHKNQKKHKSKKKRILGIVLTVLIVLVFLAAAYFFLFRWYFVEVKSVDLVSKGYDYLTLEIDSTGKPSDLRITCSDAQNSYSPELAGNIVTFRGLSSNTEYTIEITASDNHKLTVGSISEASFTTYEATSINSLGLRLGEKEGTVEVSVNMDGGRVPDSYLIAYQYEGGPEKTRDLPSSENCVTIDGLEMGKEYTFRLRDHDEYFMVGNTEASITILPTVQADNLRALDYDIKGSDVSLTLGWDCTAAVSEPWNIHITDGEGFVQDLTSDKTTCTVEGISLDSSYEVIVSTTGLYNDLTCSLSEHPYIIKNFSAEETDDGLFVTWDNLGSDPAHGWQVDCVVVGAVNDPLLIDADGNSALLKNAIPNATYQFTLKNDNTRTMVGNTTVEITTGAGTDFAGYNVKPSNIAMNLYLCPDFPDWDYTDIGENQLKSTFASEEMIAFCMQCMAANRTKSDDKAVIHYVVRDEAGAPVVIYCSEPDSSATWNGIWANYDRYCGEVEAPETPGAYKLEIYVNSMLLASSSFKVQ